MTVKNYALSRKFIQAISYMFKVIQKQLDTNLIKTSLVMALTYCTLFNLSVFIHYLGYYKVTLFKDILELCKDFIIIYIFLFVMFFGLTVHKFLFVGCTVLLFITGAIASYYLFFFQVALTKEIIKLFFGTECTKAFEIISARLILWLIFSIAIYIYVIKHFKIGHSNLFITRILSAICLLFTINCIISPPYKILKSYFPVQYLHNIYVYFLGHNSSKYCNDISNQFTYANNLAGVKKVLVVEKSARYDHLEMNGYLKETKPLLKTIQINNFKAQSCLNLAYSSVPCMLSHHSTGVFKENKLKINFLSILTSLNSTPYGLST